VSVARFIDVFIEPNDNVPEGCGQRFKSEGEPRAISRVLYDGVACTVHGWSSAGGGTPSPATVVPVEDSGGGVALLLYGGDWGLRLTPDDGSAPIGEAYLLVSDDAILG
jgi:hypothetical protein